MSFVFAVLFLRVKSVAIKHGLGNFSKDVSSNHIIQETGLNLSYRASTEVATAGQEEINCRTIHLGAYCVSYVSKKSVRRVSAKRRDCCRMFRQRLQCCVLCARADVLAVGATSVSERKTSTEILMVTDTTCVVPVSTQRVPSVAQRERASGLQAPR